MNGENNYIQNQHLGHPEHLFPRSAHIVEWRKQLYSCLIEASMKPQAPTGNAVEQLKKAAASYVITPPHLRAAIE
ncbi:MAG: hypothetical protein M3380_00245, partial [Chloroflexota bacterium]|nr:hypothetical protein [Chloroflexota bacterium]